MNNFFNKLFSAKNNLLNNFTIIYLRNNLFKRLFNIINNINYNRNFSLILQIDISDNHGKGI